MRTNCRSHRGPRKATSGIFISHVTVSLFWTLRNLCITIHNPQLMRAGRIREKQMSDLDGDSVAYPTSYSVCGSKLTAGSDTFRRHIKPCASIDHNFQYGFLDLDDPHQVFPLHAVYSHIKKITTHPLYISFHRFCLCGIPIVDVSVTRC
ncbi:uncharacterized protein HD556DRAFT_699836 [Suillus plorans]|uniref:Uncharacterized protein n=1 Tax=Suillus plorans TaxID=116603 RepID=A0A9P7DT60_9AGAM|nr:uncharacterized protein HD556DRAFT_699836 [Suillus plorans]KAG1802620.1 hypothetical protein HD556DRAFT_699836 [Suillus plorans]